MTALEAGKWSLAQVDLNSVKDDVGDAASNNAIRTSLRHFNKFSKDYRMVASEAEL